MRVMEFSTKSFDAGSLAFLRRASSGERLVIRARRLSEVVGASVLGILVLLLVLLSGVGSGLALLFVLLVFASLLIYGLQRDFLHSDPDGDLVLVRDKVVYKHRRKISRNAIEFIGVDVGEKIPNSGYPHLVYILHAGKVLPLRHFLVGREAVVLAKQVRRFAGF